MQRNIFYVIVSFFSVIFIITLGTNIVYHKKIIPNLEAKLEEKTNIQNTMIQERDDDIEELKKELKALTQEKAKIEKKLKKKLNEEEAIKLKQQQNKADKLAADKLTADKKAAEKARLAAGKAAKKKKSSKKSKAS